MEEEVHQQSNQYLTFRLDEEQFAIEINRVREVLDFSAITKVPATPDFMKGVINLRGNVVPIIDMRSKLSLPSAAAGATGCIIITEVMIGRDAMVLGAMADSVQEVVDLEPDHVDPPPRIGRLNIDFIRGMGKRGEQFVMILDVDKVFSWDEMDAIQDKAVADCAA